MKYLKFFALLTIIFLFTGCISTLFKEKIPDFSNALRVSDPTGNFTQQYQGAHLAWKNPKSLNVIMITSDCGSNQTSLSTATQNLVDSITDIKVIQETQQPFKNSKALRKSISGTIDENQIYADTLAFKYKDCTYLSSLSGKPENIDQDRTTWENFNQKIEFK